MATAAGKVTMMATVVVSSLPDGAVSRSTSTIGTARKRLTADEQRELAREIDEAVRQGALVAGKLGSGGDRDLAELLQPQVDWREALREFVQNYVHRQRLLYLSPTQPQVLVERYVYAERYQRAGG